MVQVRVLGIALDAAGQHVVLLNPVLEHSDAHRVLPIWIGPQEATSILVAIEGQEVPRPLSHDLMKTLLDTLGAQVERVEVTRIDEGTFYAEITLLTPNGRRTVDARPSDAIALAVRTAAEIWVADDVLNDAGIPAEFADPRPDEEKLEEFKEFLEDVDPEDFRG
ncbi:bifunctional nuclease family protein [Cryobacterium tepidiphilum]|uniref:Bifunctional nuclease family protein n=1 Tax=Cryobacterium tepidiphilum TaxID=2486026 RepID=A0A3M8LF91_9MICO|nr:bifunctional nuclease family protein [Cryobacterium tepidiphilum]RNE64207.1 bifunctional nuclease family protein [Cryobacterium tepidiphilum]